VGGTVGAPPHYYLGATVLCQVEVWEVAELNFSANLRAQHCTHSLFYHHITIMVYLRSRGNIRRAPRRRTRAPRRVVRRRRAPLTRRRRKYNSPACACPSELTPSARFALAQLDPFEPRCQGAKIPDSNTMPSVANSDSQQDNSLIPATAGFVTAIAFRPAYNAATVTAPPLTGSETTTVNWGNSTTQYASQRRNTSSYGNQFEAFRPVAHAIRISSSLSPTTASGFVHIGLSYESSFGNLNAIFQYPTTVPEMTGLSHYKRITLASITQSPLTVINKWIDERAFQYQDPYTLPTSTTTTANETANAFGFSWCNIIIMIEGAPAGLVSLSAEHLILTEALPKKNSVIMGTPAAPNSPGTMSAVSSMVGDIDFGHTESQQESYINQGLEHLSQGARVAGEQVFQNVAVPLLQRAGYAAAMTAGSMAFQAMTGTGGIPGVNSNPQRLAVG